MADSKFITDNTDGSFLTYNKRIIYNGTVITEQAQYKNLVDFNFGEKFLYGRVSRSFMPICASVERMAGMKSVNGALFEGSQQLAFDFVIDAFKDLQFQFEKKVASRELNPNHPFLSHLKIYKSYVDPYDLYGEHQDVYTQQIIQFFHSNKIKVQNFEEFLSHFVNILQKSLHSHPFTFSAYLKSKYCPINVSGLAIEIADEKYFDDLSKIRNFVESGSWEFFLNACAAYGFSVDKNVPWRIVADIGSAEMLNYSRNYNITNTNSIISSYYERPDLLFFDKFLGYLLKLYKSVVPKKIAHLEQCNGRTIRRYTEPQKYTLEKLKTKFSEVKLLKLYFEIRMLEEENNFTENQKTVIFKDCFSIYKIRDLADCLFAFEEIINHPFDYRGSLSYHIERSRQGYGDLLVLPDFRR